MTTPVALFCNGAGIVVERISAPETLFPPGSGFADSFHPESQESAERFVRRIFESKEAFDEPLHIRKDGDGPSLHFAGARVGGRLFIVGGESRSELPELVERLSDRPAGGSAAEAREGAMPGERPSSAMLRMNNELASMHRELQRRNHELQEVLGVVAHDLRHPIGVARGYAEVLLEDLGGTIPAEQAKLLERIVASSDGALDLLNDLLDISRIESGKLHLECEPTDLVSLVRQEIETTRLMAERKGLHLSVAAKEEIPPVEVDAPKIQQVVANLLSNGIKYSPPGSEIRAVVRPEGNEIVVFVTDEGPGISPEQQERLFRPFGTAGVGTTGEERATGLGLLICRRIVEGHGGSMGVESEEGRGSTFFFRLPVERPRARPPGC